MKDPPDLPKALMSVTDESLPTGILVPVLKSGTLKVVDPFPEPNVVPIIVNNEEYVVRETAEPSQSNIFVGIDVPTKGTTAPTGNDDAPLESPETSAFVATEFAAPEDLSPVIYGMAYVFMIKFTVKNGGFAARTFSVVVIPPVFDVYELLLATLDAPVFALTESVQPEYVLVFPSALPLLPLVVPAS